MRAQPLRYEEDEGFRAAGPVYGRVYTVAEVTGAIRELLEGSFPAISVRGEISNLSRPQSGHVYFSLMDDTGGEGISRLSCCQLPCVLWRSVAARVQVPLKNGLKVIVSGRVGVYEPRGCYQLIAHKIEPAGLGDLQRRFEELKERLRAEGLFAEERKRPLPFLPRRIGIITSPSGAAIQDVLRVLYRRHPRAWVRIVPVRVQGEGAAQDMVRALQVLASGGGQVDVILLTRGGGSLEDLWAFNEECLARAIAASPIPTVSAVGHEVDFSISDFVADVRAQTPTKAAEILVPDIGELVESLRVLKRRMALAVRAALDRKSLELSRLARARPFRRPKALLENLIERCDDLGRDLVRSFRARKDGWEDALRSAAQRLEALNPRNVLQRGYSMATDEDGRIVTDAARLTLGSLLRIEFKRGRADTRVVSTEPAPAEEGGPSGEEV